MSSPLATTGASMIETFKRLGPWLSACTLALVLSCSGRADKPAVDSNSNWLAVCEVSADCQGDGSCICGLCTRTCSDDEQCAIASPSAACIAPADASAQGACAALVSSANAQVCLATCDHDADCRAGTRCIEHACWPHPSDLVDQRDDGDASTGSTSTAVPHSDVSTLDAATDFSTPVTPPLPATTIAGDDAPSLVGVWQQHEVTFYGLIIRLDIGEVASSSYAGTISFGCVDPTSCSEPVGPPPPASDPEAGYPPDLDADAQNLLRTTPLRGTPYRMLDARAADGRLSFSFSNNDLWRDWCALQTPYPNDASGRSEYACVPEPETCDVVYERVSSVSVSPTEIGGKQLLCCAGAGVCQCSAEQCNANLQGAVHSLDLTIDGDAMTGIATLGPDTYWFVLHRAQGGTP
jgi:hypothetical protein